MVKLKYYLLQLRSLNANGDYFSCFLPTLDLKFDIIYGSTQKCWSMIFFPGYVGFHLTRESSRRGGGVAVYVSNNFNAEIIPHLTINHDACETLYVKVNNNQQNCIVSSCYRLPSCSSKIFN